MKSIGTWAYQCAAISASMRVGQCEIIARGLVVARRQNADGARPEELGTKLRARYRCGLEQIGSLRLLFGGMLAHAPFFMASSLIQSAPYARSASSIVPDFSRDRSVLASRLSWASPSVSANRIGRPFAPQGHESYSSIHPVTDPSIAEVEAYLIALQPRHDSLSLKAREIAQIAGSVTGWIDE